MPIRLPIRLPIRVSLRVLWLVGAAASWPGGRGLGAQRLPDVVGTPVATPRSAAPAMPIEQSALDGRSGRLTSTQLENLVASVALYPDALLAQVLVASTFPDQVSDAASHVRSHGTDGVDDQPWDVSVKAVAHYPSALNALADKPEWTAALGRAYADQSGDVMRAVQQLRRMADAQGNLVSNEQQRVVREQENYLITPAQPQVVYVPAYDPVVIYTRPVFYAAPVSRYWSFGIGFPIGAWLSYDLDWGTRVVYYNGWRDPYLRYAGGWRVRSRPFIHVTNIYMGPQFRTVYINPAVSRRVIDYRVIDRYPRVHGETYFAVNGRNDGWRDRDGSRDRDWDRDRDRRSGPPAEPRSAQPRGLGSMGVPVGQGRATPDGYTRVRDPERVPRDRREANGGLDAPRIESPRIESPRIERAPRADVPRVAPSRDDRARSAPSRGESRNEPRSEAGRGPRSESRSDAPKSQEPRTARTRG